MGNLAEKAHYDTKTKEMEDTTANHDKYFTTNDFNTFLGTMFDQIKKVDLASKNNIADFVKKDIW